MERVAGIGGFFFAADDPAELVQWYSQHLGVDPVPTSYDGVVWTQEAGETVFAPFSTGGDGGTPPHGVSGWGLNFRVHDLDAMVDQLRSAAVEVDVDAEVYPNGRFAQLEDPEGNVVQLWEPAAANA